MRRVPLLALVLVAACTTADAGDGDPQAGADAVIDAEAGEAVDATAPEVGAAPDVEDAAPGPEPEPELPGPEPESELPEPELDVAPEVVDTGDVGPDVAPDVPPEITEPDVAPEVVEPEDVPPPEPSALYAAITGPADGAEYDLNQPITFKGLAADSLHAEADLVATWTTPAVGELGSGPVSPSGLLDLTVTGGLPQGTHLVTLTVTNPDGDTAADTVTVVVCPVPEPETFDDDIAATDWQVYGDAFWDSDGTNGWLEMTGNVQSKKGQIFFIGGQVDPGDVTISFKILTGGGINSGADGFAMSVIGVPDVETLESYLQDAGTGGCLGYGVSGACGPWTVDAFHIEFDTWQNKGDPNSDPTSQNHVAVLRNGDAGQHDLWADIPSIEDQQWHSVDLTVQGIHVTVTLDDQVVIDDDIPGLVFHGGFIGFSGTTGWATNFHRFDDLLVVQACSD